MLLSELQNCDDGRFGPPPGAEEYVVLMEKSALSYNERHDYIEIAATSRLLSL